MKSEALAEAAPSTFKKPKKLHHIFHPSDFTEGDRSAFLHALRIAVAAKSQLQLLHVRAKGERISWADFPHITKTLQDWGVLPPAATHSDVKEFGLEILKIQHTGEHVLSQIERFAAEHHPELIVLATHQREGIDRILHRSLAEPIARDSKLMTLFVPRRAKGFVHLDTGEVRLKNILIPVERSPSPQVAIDAAMLFAETLGCMDVHFTFLHVGSDEDMPAINQPLRCCWTSESRAWKGETVENILHTAKTINAGLIVMATHGHHGFLDALRGSTTERVLRAASATVLAVPAF
jgi:nucleotide-binding universal stress UspA family protein